jgi:nucleoside phosphorylase
VTGRAPAVDVAAFTALGWETRAVLGGLAGVEPADGPRQWRGRLGDGGSCLLTQVGVGPARAAAAARAVPPAGCFLSLGCGGGLVPWMRTGDVVVATEVVALDRACRPEARSPAWVPAAEFGAQLGGIASSPGVLVTTAEKTAAAGCGAVLVDMESWALASEATRRNVPFTAVRVVLDVHADDLPFLGKALDLDTGEIDPRAAARALLARPWSWPAVLRVARQQWEAERRLAEAVTALLRSTTWRTTDNRVARDGPS